MIRLLLSILVAALPATSRVPTDPAPVVQPRPAALPGFAAELADRPMVSGGRAWPQRGYADAWGAIVAAPVSRRQAARWNLAQAMIGKQRGAEALGVLDAMAADDPDLALVPAWRRAHGIAFALLSRRREALAALTDDRLARDPESCLWRLRVADARRLGFDQLTPVIPDFRDPPRCASKACRLPGRWMLEPVRQDGAGLSLGSPAAGGLAELSCALPALAGRDQATRRPFVLAAAAAAIRTGRLPLAATWLANLPPNDPATNLLRAEAMALAGDADRARLLLKRVAATGSAEQRATATLALIEAGIASGAIDPATGLRQLDALRLTWRGDDIERRALTLSVDLAAKTGNLAGGLAAGAVLFRYFDLGQDSGALITAMQEKLAAALAPGSPLPLGQAAGLLWDYRDLLPAGAAGDRLVDTLARRLQRAGLYARAADLLQHRLTGRAEDLEKGPLSVRVASLFILAGDPDRAIRTLRATDGIAYPPDMHADRRRIEAAALDLLGKPTEALATIQDVDDVAGLRAEILWRARDWEGVVAEAVPTSGTMSDVTQAGILRHAISLAMLGREADLAAMNRRYARAFAGLPTAATFDMLTGEIGGADPETLGRAMAMLPSASPAGAIGDLIAAGEVAMAHRKRR